MNNVGNELLGTPVASINSAVNSVVNGATNTVQATMGTYGTWVLVAGILLLLLLAYLLYNGPASIQKIIPGLAPAQGAVLPEYSDRGKSTGFGENWCFIGEDATGRWCVKVPIPDACSPERLFSSRPGCELVTASPLPLGLLSKGGAEMNPMLAASHTK